MIFPGLILSYYSVDIYDILIIQNSKGELITIKIDEYERTRPSEYFPDDKNIH